MTINVTLLGGGFGRKSKPDYVAEAALLSRMAGRADQSDMDARRRHPARLLPCDLRPASRSRGRSRRPADRLAASHRVSADRGDLSAACRLWQRRRAGQGVIDMPYDIPNVRCENGAAANHARIGWYRSVYNIPHAFACARLPTSSPGSRQGPGRISARVAGSAAHSRPEGARPPGRLSELRGRPARSEDR